MPARKPGFSQLGWRHNRSTLFQLLDQPQTTKKLGMMSSSSLATEEFVKEQRRKATKAYHNRIRKLTTQGKVEEKERTQANRDSFVREAFKHALLTFFVDSAKTLHRRQLWRLAKKKQQADDEVTRSSIQATVDELRANKQQFLDDFVSEKISFTRTNILARCPMTIFGLHGRVANATRPHVLPVLPRLSHHPSVPVWYAWIHQ